MPLAQGTIATGIATQTAPPAQSEALAFIALAVILVVSLLVIVALGALALIVSRRRRLARSHTMPTPDEPPIDAWAEAGRRMPLEEGPATEPGSD
ncbi:MAG: hypothetical protein KIS87_11370 [Phycisphaeraceae bacterium]|nr:hypothetical protein [Phycisphaeraceae bacterium]